MLEHMYMRNLAIVPEADVEFDAGFNVITGETGAGKSLILGALQLLLGERAPRSVIRRGADHCEIGATVRLPRSFPDRFRELEAVLANYGLPRCEDDRLLVRRRITPTGTRNFVNSAPVTLRVLADIGDLLIDIHGPHQHQSLLQPRCQLELLDSYAGLRQTVNDCADLYERWCGALREVEELKARAAGEEDLELARYQLREIEDVDPGREEEQQLSDEHARLAHARALMTAVDQCRRGLCDADGALTDQLARVICVLQEVESYDPENIGSMVQRLGTMAEQMQDLGMDLTAYAESLEFEAEDFARLEERLGEIQRLKRKYGPSLDDVFATAGRLREQCQQAEGRAERLHALQETAAGFERDYEACCERLTAARRAAAAELGRAVGAKLMRLGFQRSLFDVDLSPARPGRAGRDKVTFCFAPNPGIEAMPLHKIASSGEIARVMLAAKTVLTAADNIPILVFDEVDANIGGQVAVQVAEELAAVGRQHQTLCISHLPQIAAAADVHYRVYKEVVDDATATRIVRLSKAQRETEIARMLGAESTSSVGREHAREMLARTNHE